MATKFEQIVEAIHAELNDPTVLRQTGRLAVKENQQLRRVVWIREPSDITPPRNVGGKLAGGVRYRQVYTREERVEAHVYAEDEDTIELLLDNLLGAMHVVGGPSIQPSKYAWETERAEGAAHLTSQPKIQLELTFMIPVFDERRPLTPLTKQGVVGTLLAEQVENIIQP